MVWQLAESVVLGGCGAADVRCVVELIVGRKHKIRRVDVGYHPQGEFVVGDKVRMFGQPSSDWGTLTRIYHSPYGRGRLWATVEWHDGFKRDYPLGALRLIEAKE